MTTRRAIIHGTGLLGASVGLALRTQGWEVAGWDPSPEALAEVAKIMGVNPDSLEQEDA